MSLSFAIAALLVELLLLGAAPRAASGLIARSRLARAAFLPAVVVHELAHATMVLLVGGKLDQVVLYRPVWARRQADEGVYGFVRWRGSGQAWQQTLVAVAPLVLIAPLVGLAVLALIGFGDGESWAQTLAGRPEWMVAVAAVACLVLPLAAFPSPGDHVPPAGLALLVGGLLLGVWLAAGGDVVRLASIATAIAVVLAPMSAGAALIVALGRR